MTVAFREALREDVPAILALLRDDHLGAQRETCGEDEYYTAWHAIQDEGGNAIYVGEAEGNIVATFQLTFITGLSHRATRRAQIESVRVATELRGRGIGRALMIEAEALARAAGCRMIQLTTHVERDRAHSFYAGLGYDPSHVGFKKLL